MYILLKSSEFEFILVDTIRISKTSINYANFFIHEQYFHQIDSVASDLNFSLKAFAYDN